jgi:hypothetical protein
MGALVPTDQFRSVFDRVTLRDDQFNTEEFPPGTSGESRLLKRLLTDSNLNRQ